MINNSAQLLRPPLPPALRGAQPARAPRQPAPSPVPQADYVVIGPLGQRIARDRFEQLRLRILARIDCFPGEIVSSKVLLGVEFWATQKSPTIVGMAIAYMSAEGLVPIVRVYPFKSDTCAYYQMPLRRSLAVAHGLPANY